MRLQVESWLLATGFAFNATQWAAQTGVTALYSAARENATGWAYWLGAERVEPTAADRLAQVTAVTHL